MLGLIDSSTKRLIMAPFDKFHPDSFRNADTDGLVKSLGRIRYMVKLHKPGLSMRRVEADLASPLNATSTWLSHILQRVVVSFCQFTIWDSKQVLSDLMFIRSQVLIALGFLPRTSMISTRVQIFLLCSTADFREYWRPYYNFSEST